MLIDRDRRLSLILEGCLRDAIQADPSNLGVDCAVQLVWPGYRPSPSRWKPLPSPNSRWLVCETAPTRDRYSQTVHINLLDGSLLVNGKPSNRLPSDITGDSAYHLLLGNVCGYFSFQHDIDCLHVFPKHDLMVVASDLPGMDFVTTSVIYKHHVGCVSPSHGIMYSKHVQIHFAVRNDDLESESQRRKTVVIRAQSIDTDEIFQLVPRENIQGDLPRSLVEGHVHWLSLSASAIETRPIEEAWEQSSDNWTIHFQLGQSRVTRGGEFLVDNQSPTWEMIAGRFRCLDDPENLIVTAAVSPVDTAQSPSSLQLSVTLPRYGLSFFVNADGNLESCDFRNMVYDEDQSVGTLLSLVNQLVLRSKTQLEVDLIPKCILIPRSDHLYLHERKVHIDLPSSGPVHHYTYQVDSDLGCLKGTSLESRLYLSRLHALTDNHRKPDPLTGRTGLEEAISLISLTATRQQTGGGDAELPSFQMPVRYTWQTLQDCTDLPGDQAGLLSREAYPFPSEVAHRVHLLEKGPFVSLHQLLRERPAPNLRVRNRLFHQNPGCHSPNIHSLRQLFSSLRTRANETAPPFQSQYISRLHGSTHDFQTTVSIGVRLTCQSDSGKPGTETLRKYYVQCRTNYVESLDMVKIALSPETEFKRFLHQCGQWPCITPYTLFRCLASTSQRVNPPESWKKCLISLALLALDLQRARRLLRFALDDLEEERAEELENEPCDGWDAAKHLDWLLMQVCLLRENRDSLLIIYYSILPQLQGNFLIRRIQVDIAKEMMSPRSGKNTVIQVNIGEGKSSVIIPICAITLADGNHLVRIIVPKALIPQTLQILTDRLSGLVNRPIYHLAFCRDDIRVEGAIDRVKCLHTLVQQCRDDRGIIVMQPEHVLSLKLACVESQFLEEGIWTNSTPVAQKQDSGHVLRVLTGSQLKWVGTVTMIVLH